MSHNDLSLALEPHVSAQYERMSHSAKLEMIGLKEIIELVSEGYMLSTGKRSKRHGILNEIGVTTMSFNKWILGQDSFLRDELNSAMLTQSLQLKQSMLESAIDSVDELEDLAAEAGSPKDKITASNLKASIAIKVLKVLDHEHQKLEKQAPAQTRQVEAHISSSEQSRARLLKLREEKNDT